MILVEGYTAYDTDFAMFYTLYHIFKQESIQGRGTIKGRSVIKVGVMVLEKLPNSEQSSKGKVKTHKHIHRQNQSTTAKLGKP
jgi:hypothetical protein